MLSSSVHSVSAPSRPRPPGASRKSKTIAAVQHQHPPSSNTSTSASTSTSTSTESAPSQNFSPFQLPADALASHALPARASTMPADTSAQHHNPHPHQRTLQPSRSRLLNVFGADGVAGAGWSDDSRPGTPKSFAKHLSPSTPAGLGAGAGAAAAVVAAAAGGIASPTTDEQFSALINVALANMASRSNSNKGNANSASQNESSSGNSSASRAAALAAMASSSDLDADHIGGLSRQELEDLLVAANRKIMERERDIAIAAQIGRTLVEKHDSIKAKHDGILRALAVSNHSALPALVGEHDHQHHHHHHEVEVEVGPPRYTPPSNDTADYFGNAAGAGGATPTMASAAAFASTPTSAFADTSFERRSTDSASSHLSHRRSMGSAAAAYMQHQLEELEMRNDDLYIEVEALRSKAEDDKKRDSERLRGIQREMEALKAELSMAYSRNAELEEVARLEDERRARQGTEAWKKRVQGGSITPAQRRTQEWWADATASPIKLVVQRPASATSSSNDVSTDEHDASADLSWDSRSGDQGLRQQRLDEEEEEEEEEGEGSFGDAARLPSRDDLADAAAQDTRERALVAQLLSKIRELEEANSAISARAKEFGDRAGRAFEQGERIKDGYEAVESASRMDLAGELEAGTEEGSAGDHSIAGAAAMAAAAAAPGGGDSSFSMRSASGQSAAGDSPVSSALLLRRRAPGNRYAIEGRRTVRSAIRREKAALAELLAAQQQAATAAAAAASGADVTLGGGGGGGDGTSPAQQPHPVPNQTQTMPNSLSLSSISSFTSSLGSLRASSSESSFRLNLSRGSQGPNTSQGSGHGHGARTLKKRMSSALMLGRPKIRITPSCEDMAAAREEEAAQKQGGWEDDEEAGGTIRGGMSSPSGEVRDEVYPLEEQAYKPAHVRPVLPSARSLRRIASESFVKGNSGSKDGNGDGNGSDSDGSPFTSRRRSSATRRRGRLAYHHRQYQSSQSGRGDMDDMTPSSSMNSMAYPSSGGLMGTARHALTLGSELGSEFGDAFDEDRGDGGASLAADSPERAQGRARSQQLAIQSRSALTASAPNTPLKYRRPRRTQSSMTLGVGAGTDDEEEDALSDIAELRFSVAGSSPDRSMDVAAAIGPTPSASRTAELDLTLLSPLDTKLHLNCSPASDGVWRGDEPVVPRGALRDGEMTQYAGYDLLERAADHHPVAWADDEDFGRPITEGEARRLKLLEDGRSGQRVGLLRSRGLLSWLAPEPKKKKRGGELAQQQQQIGGPARVMGEIESQEQIEERRQMGELLRQKRLAALQRAAAAKRGSSYDLSPSSHKSAAAAAAAGSSHYYRHGRHRHGGEAAENDDDDEDEEEDEIEARALAFSPSRQRRVKRLSLHGALPPSGEELLLVPGAGIRKRRSKSKLREVAEPSSSRTHQMQMQLSRRPPPRRKHSAQSLSACSQASSQDANGEDGGRSRMRYGDEFDGGDEDEEEDEEDEERFELVDVPESMRRHRSGASGAGAAMSTSTRGTDYYPVDLYARYKPSMVQSRVKVASNEVVTLISTWALFATVTVFAFVVAFS
ncbi:hypothetical protein OC842_004300 [Tilletia horrida]|uniref:Uncharacterized protein n=1 Tax=Tilletia horrida TaxID=155126 RepID=A0AAN6GCH5_9BASI|nr:hypothetical protein OC842_004300 [Tilletia horrida]